MKANDKTCGRRKVINGIMTCLAAKACSDYDAGFKLADDGTGFTCVERCASGKYWKDGGELKCIAACPYLFVEAGGQAECVDSCPASASFHEASGRCVSKCACDSSDGLCGKKGSTIVAVVAVLGCVGALDLVSTAFCFCSAKGTKKCNCSKKKAQPKKLVLRLAPRGPLKSPAKGSVGVLSRSRSPQVGGPRPLSTLSGSGLGRSQPQGGVSRSGGTSQLGGTPQIPVKPEAHVKPWRMWTSNH